MSLFLFIPTGGHEIPQLLAAEVADLNTIEPQASGDRPQVSHRFNSDGTIESATGNTGAALSYSTVGNWLDNSQAPIDNTDWEIRLTIDSEDVGDPGTFTGLTAGTWTELSSAATVTWTKDGTDLGTASAAVTYDIRQKSANSNSATLSGVDYGCTISA